MIAYLIKGISYYTNEEFNATKSVEAYMQFTNEWVQDLQIYTPSGSDRTVVLAKVRTLQSVLTI